MLRVLSTVVIAALAGGVSALAAVYWFPAPDTVSLQSPDPQSAADPTAVNPVSAERVAALSSRVAELEQALAAEQQGRLMLQRALTEQAETLVELQALATNRTEAGATTAETTPVDSVHQSAQATAPADQSRRIRIQAADRQQALIAAGIERDRAAELTQRQDAVALARLELRDQAAREGWLDESDADERISQALADLQLERVNLRSELTAEQWDRYLYQSGRPNRVVVASVLAGSVAAEVQIVAGDQLLSYAGQPMYRSRDLQRATQSGQRGESVIVKIGRDGAELELVVPRGPLGVTLSPLRFDPDSNS
ncbi:MAG: PDZ domain-containing protein [Gammaproteobacteria bacterium]|nr:PDZ domain-containing protein [Gammaproteobacteria bacterium]